ncbi:hypothetical protein [Gordonia crocea]|uniref:Uncharacterized protein n=1 Tax=Gordonia crocea TaxID=589162 RepID=A0A7M3SUX8_9ACTN|nr:hypothetical protein [Gordonia crocea]GED96452.1 hypothetical protein nbrc107697_04910 [Gordonia crocea]
MPTSDSLGTDFLEADILIPHHFDDYIFNHGFLSGEWSPGRDRVDAILGRPGRPRRPRYGYGGEWESKPVIPGRLVRPQPQPLRRRECEEVGAQLLRPSPGIVVIAGKPGSGRSAMVAGVAAAIRDADRTRRLRQIPATWRRRWARRSTTSTIGVRWTTRSS